MPIFGADATYQKILTLVYIYNFIYHIIYVHARMHTIQFNTVQDNTLHYIHYMRLHYIHMRVRQTQLVQMPGTAG